MKKILAFLLSILIALASLGYIGTVYQDKISNRYYDGVGDLYGNMDKNRGIALQSMSALRGDNLLMYGSSDLGTVDIPSHPSNFFKDKKDGFQVNLIGRGYSQSIIHAINFGAISGDLKGKKIAFFVSPPWFESQGLSPEGFGMNFSQLQFYALMFNESVSKPIKLKIAERVFKLTEDNQDLRQIRDYCYLYSRDNILSKALLYVLMPYHRFKYFVLSVKDKIDADKILKAYEGKAANITPQSSSFNWEEEREAAAEYGKKGATNNQFQIEDTYYNTYIKNVEEDMKGAYKDLSYSKSPEYEDFKLLLDLCKEQGIDPLFINVPLNGRWFDYGEFDKQERNNYYKKINEMVESYGFSLADFSEYEYEDYFLKDIFHIGWKGWVYINEAMDKYYREK